MQKTLNLKKIIKVTERTMPKVPKIFMSHSRLDKKYCDAFQKACESIGFKVFRSEFENIEKPPWETLKRQISQSPVLFLLIGKEFTKIQKSLTKNTPEYDRWMATQNWIAYEIGVSAQKGIDVWVLCENIDIYFPVPYFTNLYFWEGNLAEQKELFFYLETYKENKYILFDKRMRHTCTNPNCGIRYIIIQRLAKGVKIKCPSCLEINEFPEGFNLNNKQELRILKKLAGVRLRDTKL
jgi:hypothetical protein